MTGILPVIILSAKEAAKHCGIKHSEWIRLVDAGKAPRAIRRDKVGWNKAELESWITAGRPPCHVWQYKKPIEFCEEPL
jgi:hypothetical protein